MTDEIGIPPHPLFQTGNGRHEWCIEPAYRDDDSIEILHHPSMRRNAFNQDVKEENAPQSTMWLDTCYSALVQVI